MPAAYSDYESKSSPAVLADSSSRSPIMRKASPLPLPAYPTPNSPWHHTSNGLTSPSPDTTPTAGKTTQVLARITGENDRLRREFKAEKAAKEDALQQYQALKGQVGWLQDKNATLTMQYDAAENALVRKERRVDDLKASLEEEVARRKRAEEREAEMGRRLGETVSQAAKEVSEAHMAQKHAENAYATIQNEYSGLERRMKFLQSEINTAVGKIDAEKAAYRKQLQQLEVLLDQQRQQQERSDRQVHAMSLLLKDYRDTEENVKKLETELQNTVHEMRWVMRLHKSREETTAGAVSSSHHGRQDSTTSISHHSREISSNGAASIPASPQKNGTRMPQHSSPLKNGVSRSNGGIMS